ncbi:MAG: heme lyase CcmF/NrfE family subunit [Chloroflexi bacterium]|nr:heme lyase CcmF/NrfE family subunit [Chloroflexota bacterium]
MIANTGLVALILAFGLAVYATVFSAYAGWRRDSAWLLSARNAALAVFPLLTLSTFALVYSLVTRDFSISYVADVSSRAMSTFLRVTALWGGQEGSILFWAWLMSGFVAATLLRNWRQHLDLMPFVISVAMLTTGFFVGLALFLANPFARLWEVPGAARALVAIFPPAEAVQFMPADGRGLNPLLRHFGMIGHPPTTYLGFTGFVIPFSFAMAALITGKAHEDTWIRATRRWTLVAWVFLSIGLILGGRWAYDVLGWGGFWGWDPVENAMLMPWLTGTAFLHSVMITEKRGMLKVWSLILIILTYALALFGTFITRTGVVSSVHAFAQSALGPAFFIFIAVTFIGSLYLLLRALPTLKSEHELESFMSREAVFLLQNVLFLAITFAVFWGTVFPMISELVTGTKITVGPPYFKKVTGPLFALLLLLMGVAPLFAWRKQSAQRLGKALMAPFLAAVGLALGLGLLYDMHPGAIFGLWLVTFVFLTIALEFWKGMRARMSVRNEAPWTAFVRLLDRNHRRYGGYIVHLGVVMIALGILGDAYLKQETQGPLAVGEVMTLGDYELRFDGLVQYPGSDGREVVEASTTLMRNGEVIRELRPRRDYFVVQQQPVTIPAVYSTLGADVYVLLVGWEEIGLRSSTFKLYINPLINWVWIGGLFMILGTVIAAWGTSHRRDVTYTLPSQFRSNVVVVGGSG